MTSTSLSSGRASKPLRLKGAGRVSLAAGTSSFGRSMPRLPGTERSKLRGSRWRRNIFGSSDSGGNAGQDLDEALDHLAGVEFRGAPKDAARVFGVEAAQIQARQQAFPQTGLLEGRVVAGIAQHELVEEGLVEHGLH